MYVGLDTHKRQNVATVVDEKGIVVQQCIVQNKGNCMEKFLEPFPANTKFALEAYSVWEPIYDFIESREAMVFLVGFLQSNSSIFYPLFLPDN